MYGKKKKQSGEWGETWINLQAERKNTKAKLW